MRKFFFLLVFVLCGLNVSPVLAQNSFAPIEPIRLAQFQNPTIIPTDVTPTGIGEERELFTPGKYFYFMQKLPKNLWISSTTECTQRLETNIFFTRDNNIADYAFRIQPNTTVGYNILPHTSVYCNYFFIKDVFAGHERLGRPNFMSLGGGVQHEIPIGTKSNLQLNFLVRELWQARNLHQADMLPGITFTHVFNKDFIMFGNTQLQLRSRNPFQGAQREIDPFFTVGAILRKKDWILTLSNTYVANFRNAAAIPPMHNMAMISDVEVSRQISKKMPGLVSFVRAEPIWNWWSHGRPGLSGFDFRLFTGLRYTFNKPSYYSQYSKLKKQIEQEASLPTKMVPSANNSNSTQTKSQPESISQVLTPNLPEKAPQIPIDPGSGVSPGKNTNTSTNI